MNYYLSTDNLVNSIVLAEIPKIDKQKPRPILTKGVQTSTVTCPLQPIQQNILVPPNPITTNVVVETPPGQNQIVPYEEPEDPFTQHDEMPSDFDLIGM